MSSPSGVRGAAPGLASPGWLPELLEVLDERRRLLIAAAVALSVVGVLSALLLPQFVPPRPVVGAAVGLAAALLSVAIAVAADSADLTVRGSRHVRAAGGQVAAVLDADPTAEAAAGLAARIDARAAAGGRHWVALAPADRGFGSVSRWADVLGVALAGRGRRVVVIDLADGPTPGTPGVVEVVGDELKLGQAVDFDRELMLARLGPGADDVAALELLTGLVPRLPSDIEILVVALPPLGQPGALAAAGTLDRVLVLAQAGVTARVDLIASLDAIDATATASEVVLVDEERAGDGPWGDVATASADGPGAELGDAWEHELEPAGEVETEPAPVVDDEPAPRHPVVWDDEPEPVDEPAPARAVLGRPVLAVGRQAAPPTPATTTVVPEPDPVDGGPAPEGPDVLALGGEDEHVHEAGRWAAPPRHEAFTGANLEGPPLAPAGDDDEDVRVAAALQTLAQEVWARDEQG